MTVLKFAYSSTVEFSDLEVLNINIIERQRMSLMRLCNGAPRLIFNGPSWRDIIITILPGCDFSCSSELTSARINTLRQVTENVSMIMYYGNGELNEIIPVRINSNIEIPYRSGDDDANTNLVLYCTEISSGLAVVPQQIINTTGVL